MNTKLEQKRFFGQKKFELRKDDIKIFEDKYNEELEYSIDYLDLGVQTFKKSIKNSAFIQLFFWAFFIMQLGVLIQSLIFEPENKGMIMFFTLGSGFFLGFIFLLRWQPLKKLIFLTGGQKSIEFFQEKPSEKQVNDFINTLKSKVKNAYKNEYLKWDENTSQEQKKFQLEYLKRIKILDEDEYQDLINKLDNNVIIGFKSDISK